MESRFLSPRFRFETPRKGLFKLNQSWYRREFVSKALAGRLQDLSLRRSWRRLEYARVRFLIFGFYVGCAVLWTQMRRCLSRERSVGTVGGRGEDGARTERETLATSLSVVFCGFLNRLDNARTGRLLSFSMAKSQSSHCAPGL